MPNKLLIALLWAAVCFGQSDLRQRLNLTDGQAAAIQKLNQDYNNAWFVQQNRVEAINLELRAIVAAPVPDATEIGVRAVELEMIRRDRVAKQAVLRTDVAGLLSTAQGTSIQQLIALYTLEPLARDASCAYLVNSRSYPGQVGPWYSVFYRPNSIAPPLPYIPPAPTGSFCGLNTFPVSVRDYLGLSDAQIASIYAISAAFEDFSAREQNRLTDLQLEIQDLMATPGTDAVALGLRYAERAKIGRDLDGKKAQWRDAAKGLLNSAQSSKLTQLQDAQVLSEGEAISFSIGCNLLQLPAGSGGGAPDTGQSSFCVL